MFVNASLDRAMMGRNNYNWSEMAQLLAHFLEIHLMSTGINDFTNAKKVAKLALVPSGKCTFLSPTYCGDPFR